jgi:hypothetical protein
MPSSLVFILTNSAASSESPLSSPAERRQTSRIMTRGGQSVAGCRGDGIFSRCPGFECSQATEGITAHLLRRGPADRCRETGRVPTAPEACSDVLPRSPADRNSTSLEMGKPLEAKIKQSDEEAGSMAISATDARGGDKVLRLSRRGNGGASKPALSASLVGSRLSPRTYSPHVMFFRSLWGESDLNYTFFNFCVTCWNSLNQAIAGLFSPRDVACKVAIEQVS